VLLIAQGVQLIATILGVLKAGKSYVPLDPAHPVARLAYMVEDAQPGLIVADDANGRLAQQLAERRYQLLDLAQMRLDGPDHDLQLALSPDLPAYIFYTSGTTGQPKGVVDSHRNVLHNVMRYTNSLGIRADDRLTLLQSCSFSGSVSSLFSALLNGAASLPFDVQRAGIAAIPDWLDDERITIYHSVPLIFRQLFGSGRRFPSLRIIRLEGDQAARIDVALYQTYLSDHARLVNGLGATETGITRQYVIDGQTQLPASSVPIGYPVADMTIVLLDEDGRELTANAVGEIAVKSRYLATGYWRKPELTAAAFQPDPAEPGQRIYRTGDLGRMQADGCLELLGRTTFQAKIRGQRVDYAEIEAALLTIAGISEAVVQAQPDQLDTPQLVAYLVPGDGSAPTINRIRQALAARLPDYMIPSQYVTLNALPLNANGKLNRKALPAPSRARPDLEEAFVAARTPVERALAAIWAETLDLTAIGVHDNFFALGGHSLHVARLISAVQQTLGVRLPQRSLFDMPTVAAQAARIEALRSAAHSARAARPSGAQREEGSL
jgi:amino acid adenylation domain-containing protein